MPKSIKVNVSVPLPIDVVLTALAKERGVSKSAVIVSQLVRALPYWKLEVRKLRSVESRFQASERSHARALETGFDDD